MGWMTVISNCQAQNCAVSAGNNFGTKIQSCGPIPQISPLKPPLGKSIVPINGPQGTFLYQVFVKITGPTDIRVVACGDDITDARGRPDRSVVVSVSVLNGLPKNCVGKQLNQIASGTWLLEGISKSKDKPVRMLAVFGDFPKLP